MVAATLLHDIQSWVALYIADSFRWSSSGVVCRATIGKFDPDIGMAKPQSPAMASSCSPGALPRLAPAHQSFLVPDGYKGSGLIGAVHLPNPISHTTGHSGGVVHHVDHLHGQPESLSQSPEGMGGFKMAEGVHGMGSKGGHPGGNGFGFSPYTRTEAPSKLQASSAWDSAPQGSPQALDDLEDSNLNAFWESMDSEARADFMNGQHFQQHFPQQQQQQHHKLWPAGAKFELCD